MIWTLLATAVLLQQPPSSAPEAPKPGETKTVVQVSAKVTPEEIQLGNTIQLEVTAKHAQDVRVYFPASPDLGTFRVVGSISGPEKSIQNEQVVQKWIVPIASLRLGRRKIPPFAIDYEDPEAETGQVKTPPIAINIISRINPQEDNTTVAPNDPPLALLDTNWTLILLLIGLGVISVTAVITLIAVRYVAALPRRGPPPPPPRPAHEVAWEKLSVLKDDKLLEKNEFKGFTFRLSEILREYLGLRFNEETLELTSSELMKRMKAIDPSGLSIYELEEFLRSTDLVKFARLTPTYSEAESNLNTCERVVEKTRLSDAEVTAMRQSEEQRRMLEKPAHPFKRTFAILIDLLIYAVISTSLVLMAKQWDLTWLYWIDAIGLATFIMFRDAYGPGSPGKVLVGMALTPQDSIQPERLGLKSRILRNIPLLLPIAGHTMEFVVMTYAADGRRVGDRWSGSRVLDQRPEASERVFLIYSIAALAALVVVGWLVPFVWLGG